MIAQANSSQRSTHSMVLEMDASNTNEVKLWMQLAYVALKQQPWVELFPSLNRDTLVLHMHSMHACMHACSSPR